MAETSTPDPTEQFVNRAKTIHGAIGAELDGFGGYLQCNSCGHKQDMRTGDSGRYLKAGWPTCCTYTMTWVTQNLIDQEAGGE
jgi:hypothetical protein